MMMSVIMFMVYEYMDCSNNCKVEKHSNMNGMYYSHKEGGDNGMKREVYVILIFFRFSLSPKKIQNLNPHHHSAKREIDSLKKKLKRFLTLKSNVFKFEIQLL